LHVASNSNVAPATLPSGFSLVDSIGTAPTIYVYAKTAGGSEPATYDVTWASGTHNAAVSAFTSDAAAVLVIDAHENQANGVADRLLPSIATTVANTLLVGLASLSSNVSTTPPGSMAERYDVGTGPRLWMATEAIAAAGETGTRTPSGTDAANNVVALAIAEQAAALETPTDLTATAVSATQIDLAWADTNDDEDGFEIERSLNGSDWALIHTNAADDLTYSDTGLTPGTTYYYRVRTKRD
jgi:hypothetical protein